MIKNSLGILVTSVRTHFIFLLVGLSRYFFTFIMRGWILKLFLASRGYFSISIMADQNGFFLGEKAFIKRAFFRKADILVDIGANVGDYSAFALEAGAKQVFAVEPNPSCFKVLQQRFGKRSNVNLFNVAISGSEGLVDLQVPSSDAHGEGSIVFEIAKEFQNDTIKYEVNGMRLENLPIPIRLASVIKIDVEGSEFEVLEQLSSIVGPKNKYIQFEFNRHHATVGTSITMIKLLFPNYNLMQLDLVTGNLLERNKIDPFTELYLSSVFVLERK